MHPVCKAVSLFIFFISISIFAQNEKPTVETDKDSAAECTRAFLETSTSTILHEGELIEQLGPMTTMVSTIQLGVGTLGTAISKGEKPRNQDGFLVIRLGPAHTVILQMDGVGGHGDGKKSIEYIAYHVKKAVLEEKMSVHDALLMDRFYLPEKEKKDSSYSDWNSSATLVAVEIIENKATITHFGDSRLVQIRKSSLGNEIVFSTVDHSIHENNLHKEGLSFQTTNERYAKIKASAQEDLKTKKRKNESIIADINQYKQQCAEDRRNYSSTSEVTGYITPCNREGNVTRGKYSKDEISLIKGDRLIIASDGLWGNWDNEHAAVWGMSSSPAETAYFFHEISQNPKTRYPTKPLLAPKIIPSGTEKWWKRPGSGWASDNIVVLVYEHGRRSKQPPRWLPKFLKSILY